MPFDTLMIQPGPTKEPCESVYDPFCSFQAANNSFCCALNLNSICLFLIVDLEVIAF